MKYYFVLILFAFGCQNSDSPNRTLPENNTTQIEKEKIQNQSATETPLDTSMITTPVETKPSFHTNYTTYPQIKRHLFTIGSSRNDVMIVQGRPELIEQYPKEDEEEVWYYGECEIIFLNGLVDEVRYSNPTIKYVSIHDLLSSDNPVDRNMGRKMLSKSSNNIYRTRR